MAGKSKKTGFFKSAFRFSFKSKAAKKQELVEKSSEMIDAVLNVFEESQEDRHGLPNAPLAQDDDSICNQPGTSNKAMNMSKWVEGLGGMQAFSIAADFSVSPPGSGTADYKLSVTLEEVLTGKTKYFDLSRKVYGEAGLVPNYTTEVTHYDLVIPKGIEYGSIFTLRDAGDRAYGQLVGANVGLEIAPIEHDIFKRGANNVDLVTTIPINLADAVSYNAVVIIPTLDGSAIPKIFEQLITDDFELRLPGQGLPYFYEPNKRGDMLVRFKVVYPEKMTEEDKLALAESLER